MNRRWFLLSTAAALVVASGVAEARVHAPYRAHRIVPPAAPLDGLPTPFRAFSFRKVIASYSGPAVRLIRTGDSVQQDIGFVGFVPGLGAPPDIVAINTFCTTPCRVHDWYDQTGNAAHLITNPYSPLLVQNCIGGLPCMQSISGTLIGAPQIAPAAISSFAAVGKSDSAPAICGWLRAGAQTFGSHDSGPIWYLNNGVTGLNATATHGTWHAGNGVINGAASVINIDGTETTGPMTAVATADWLLAAQAATANPCSTAEAIYWDGSALSPAQRQAIVANQRRFWGF